MSEPNVSYEPNKNRSRPLRFILLPLVATFLFILYWFSLCPLLYVALRRMNLGWTPYWHYYFWICAFFVFLIILGLLVLLWRKKCKHCPHPKSEPHEVSDTKELLKVEPAEDALRNKEIDKNIKALEKKLDGDIDKNTINPDEIKVLDDKEQLPMDQPNVPTTKSELTGFVRNDLQNVESKPEEPSTSHPPINLNKVAEETKVELHSPAYPLTPREIFFWDLIQSANKNDSVKFNFNESDKGDESGDDRGLTKSDGGSIRSASEEVQDGSTRSASDDVQDGSFTSSPISVDITEEPRRVEEEPLIAKQSPPCLRSDATLQMVHSPSDTEYFIANVPDRKSLSSEAYLYVDGDKDGKCYQIRIEKPDHV